MLHHPVANSKVVFHCFWFPPFVASFRCHQHKGSGAFWECHQTSTSAVFVTQNPIISGKSTPWMDHGCETTWLSHGNETMTHDSRFEWLAASKSLGFARWRNWIFSLVVGGATSQLDFFLCVVFAASRLGMFQQSCLLMCWCFACLNDPQSQFNDYQEFEV